MTAFATCQCCGMEVPVEIVWEPLLYSIQSFQKYSHVLVHK